MLQQFLEEGYGQVQRHWVSEEKGRFCSGRNELSLAKAKKIMRLGMNKLFTGTRPIGAKVGCDKKTVAKYLRKAGAKKAYHRRKVQKMTQDHMDKRVR